MVGSVKMQAQDVVLPLSQVRIIRKRQKEQGLQENLLRQSNLHRQENGSCLVRVREEEITYNEANTVK